MKVKKVFKYGTGQPIPEGAIYLSTQTEVFEKHIEESGHGGTLKKNLYVWHYFLVSVEEK